MCWGVVQCCSVRLTGRYPFQRLQCVEVCSSLLQCVLQRVATSDTMVTTHSNNCKWPKTHRMPGPLCSVLQYVAVCCSVLQCVAVCCSVLQCVAVCCNGGNAQDAWSVQCVAVCCSMLQRAAICCSVLQCVAICCSVLQCVAMVVCAVCYSRMPGLCSVL